MTAELHVDERDADKKASGAQRLSHLLVFAGMAPDILANLDLAQETVCYQAGDTVVASGYFDGSLLYGILSGRARIVKPAVKAGDFEVVEGTVGDIVGLAELLAYREQSPSGLGMTALSDLELLLIDGELLLERAEDTPELSKALVSYAARQWLEAGRTAESEAHRDRRLLRHLLSLAERQGERFVISDMPRHAQLAEQCGVTDRDAAAAIATLIEKGIVRRDYPSLVIEDMAALRASAY